MVVVGSGSVGRALALSANSTQSARVVGIFDDTNAGQQADVFKKTGNIFPTRTVQPSRQLPRYIRAFDCNTAVLTSPDATEAQGDCDMCIKNGITRLINYSGASLKVPAHVACEDGWSLSQAESTRSSPTEGRFRADFDPIRVIGKGGFGAVIHARHRVDGHEYAVKRIALVGEGDHDDWMLNESMAMANLPYHPNLVRYHGSWVEQVREDCELEPLSSDSEGSCSWNASSYTTSQSEADAHGRPTSMLYIQMELCKGPTLATFLQDEEAWTGGAAEAHRMQLFEQIVSGVVHIHNAGFVHRDLKPQNVFLTGDNVPRIGDFGLCSRPGEHWKAPHDLGTNLYMAPELKDGEITDKADIFALGVCLFELCHRHHTVMERIELLGKLRDSGCMPAELLGSPLGVLILSMVNHDPACRPTAQELLALLSKHAVASKTSALTTDDLVEQVRSLQEALADRNQMVARQAEMIAALQAQLQGGTHQAC